jgi:hypothetical protein
VLAAPLALTPLLSIGSLRDQPSCFRPDTQCLRKATCFFFSFLFFFAYRCLRGRQLTLCNPKGKPLAWSTAVQQKQIRLICKKLAGRAEKRSERNYPGLPRADG